jgi:hypothetical protein
MITLILIIFAAILSAVQDSLAFQKDKSIFSRSVTPFWSIENGMLVRFTHFRLNAWHVCKALMIIALVVGGIMYKTMITMQADIPIYIAAWVSVYNLFFDRLLGQR